MQNCPKCGAEVDDLATVCPSCGSQIESKPSSQDAPLDNNPLLPKKAKATPSPPAPVDVTKRPTLALITAILLILGGALMAYFCIPYLYGASQGGVTLTYTTTSTLTTVTNSTTVSSTSTSTGVSNFSGSLLATVGLPYAAAGIASLIAGFGFLNRMKIAWRLALVVSIFGIVQTFLLLSDPFNLFIGVAVLYLQTRPQVRAWLKGPTDTDAPSK